MVWTCRLHTFKELSEEKMAELEEYCYAAAMNDPTFKFTIESENKDGKVTLNNIIIECEDKNQAHKRGMLFHHRYGIYYEVEWKKNE
jgi:hypothetical protein